MAEQPLTELARAIVTQIAPHELPLFSAMSRVHAEDPDRARPRHGGGDDVLSFGLGTTATLLTPVVLAIADQVARYLAEDLGKSLAHMTASAVTERVGRLLRREPGTPPLTQAQLSRIHDIAIEVARTCAVPEAQAPLLANALIGKLAIAAP